MTLLSGLILVILIANRKNQLTRAEGTNRIT